MFLKRRSSEGYQRVNIRGKRRASEVNKTVRSPILEKKKKANPQFSILNLPNEILLGIYPHLDLSGRRGLRVNERMERIEMEVEYHYRTLDIIIHENTFVCDKIRTVLEKGKMKKEIEMLKNTHFDRVTIISIVPIDNDIIESMKFLNTRSIVYDYPGLCNDELYHILQNKKGVIIKKCKVNKRGLRWLYWKILEGKLDVKFVKVESSADDLLKAKEMMTADNHYPIPTFLFCCDEYVINHEKVVVEFYGIHECSCKCNGFVNFFLTKEDDSDDEWDSYEYESSVDWDDWNDESDTDWEDNDDV